MNRIGVPGSLAIAAMLVIAAPAQANNAADDGDKMICKHRLETGTRFKKKVCKTAAEWEAIAEAHRNGLKEMTDRPQIEIRRD